MVVNGHAVTPAAGWSILDAARVAGITIPTLCHHAALPPDGSCRLCVVEIDGRPGLHPACVEPAVGGRRVQTDTPATKAARRNVLALLLRRYRPRPGTADNEFLALVRAHGLDAGGASPVPPARADESDPFLRFDPAACVRCWRCVRACERLNGVAAIGVFGRGADARIGFGLDQPMVASPCESCGMCEAVCPTDAFTVKGGMPAPTARATTICSYCGVGCRLAVRVDQGRVVGTEPEWSAPANHGLACVKGRFGWSYLHHRDRLTRPLVRRSLLGGEGDALVETEWDTALELVANRLAATAERWGADRVGFLASAKCSNEENYLVQKLARQLVGTNNVDHCARLCHAPTVTALAAALGSGAMTNSMDDIVRDAAVVLVVGSNTTEQHPVLGMRLRRAVRERGVPVVVVDPRAIPLTEVAALHLRLRPGTDVALLNALAHVLIAEDRVDRAFVTARTEGFEVFAASVRNATPERAEISTGVPAGDIRRAARLLADHRPGALLYAMGVTQHTSGTANAHACVNLQLLLGNFGVPGAGVNPLRGQNNVQGACDVGALPDVLPGYQPVSDAAARARLASAWGVTTLSASPGLTVTEQLDAAGSGTLRALWILGENVAMTEPDLAHTRRCLAACEFLVVHEIFPSETTAYAHVVLPAAASAEKAGTFTNTERRVQRFDPVVFPPGEARPDWWILAEVGRRLAALRSAARSSAPHAGWAYRGPADVMDEIAALTPIYGGIRHTRLGDAGLQWPCRSTADPGTPILHVGTFGRGRARFTPVAAAPAAEIPDAAYPLTLTTGRVLEHYHGGSMSRRVAGLNALVPEALAEIHPADAAGRGIADGERVRVSSRRGSVAARARLTPGIARGTVFLPFHFAEAAANELTIGALDPIAKIPEYKVCAVRLDRLGAQEESP